MNWKNRLFDTCLNQQRLAGRIRAVVGCVRVGLTLKGSGTEKRGGETKILKRGQAGSRGGCLKKGELELPYKLREGCSGG